MGLFCFFVLLLFHSLNFTSAASNEDVVKKLLLQFKQSSVQSDPHGLTCSEGHVITLDLSYSGLIGSHHLPTLTALPSLQNLYLQGNSFSASDLSVSNISTCCLVTVDLSSNNITSPLPVRSFLEGCENLALVNLSGNSIPGGSFSFGASLLQLDISRNLISDSSLLTCQNLNLLNVSGYKLTGKQSDSILSCKNLTTLDLSYNALSGEIPNTILESGSASLKYLDLSSNNFTGKFASLDFGQCSSLTLLKLSHNNLYGDEFPSSLANCQALETLNLTSNKLQDKIPGALLGNLNKLRQLFLGRNQFSGEIPAELGKACGTLQELDISDNILTGELPSSFVSCSSLVSLNLGRNQLSGNFLSTVVSKLPSLRYLYVPFNNITGPVPPSITNGTRLQVLDLSANLFTGNVPSVFCFSNAPSALEKILLANNFLSGTVPSELGNCKSLKAIDLSFNS
ncbi:putative transferase [Rosa chinensis]|uniref:Putative transferase n=1 Tax=Rosa chinensis TaxID=74649 RepID=A0A2P6QL70_ROSCH|nr:putative transferase [Rosa chinensis]